MWFNRKKDEEVLQPGECECGHGRCHHENGKGRCRVDLSESTPKEIRDSYPDCTWGCACQIFILDEDGGDDGPETPIDPEVAELKKLAGMS